jgi:hypothetical protein
MTASSFCEIPYGTRLLLMAALLAAHVLLSRDRALLHPLGPPSNIIGSAASSSRQQPPRVAFVLAGRVVDAAVAPTEEDAARWHDYIVAPQLAVGMGVDFFVCLAEPLGLDTEVLGALGAPRASFVFSAASQFKRWQICAQALAEEVGEPYAWYILLRPDLQLFSELPPLTELNASAVHTRARGAYLTDALFPGLTSDHFSYGYYSATCGDAGFAPRDGIPRPWVMADDQLLVVPARHWPAVSNVSATWDDPAYEQCNTWIPITRTSPPYGSGLDSFPEADLTRGLMCGGTGTISPLKAPARLKRSRTHDGPCDFVPCQPPISKVCGSGPE